MFQLDDQFLTDIGLNDLPEEQKKPFLQYVYDKLELAVGMELASGLTEAQENEFGDIIDRRDDVISNWLYNNAPNYKSDDGFRRIMQAYNITDENDKTLRDEYAATKWLEINRPNYREIVLNTMSSLKEEIANNKDAILNSQDI
ncbi:hypothetical protein KBD70_00685 [Candidatus Saccharibacteria bacterium]|jgi:hypothetical protein|nr:hypothetical protein [Candidatus Saccharibacteria bacterium]MBP9985821.1 hypothetical protein [Candidatus Saccharibacteria bacterium]